MILTIIGHFFVLGYVYGFIVKPILDAKAEEEAFDKMIELKGRESE
jgi:hypothetical protein